MTEYFKCICEISVGDLVTYREGKKPIVVTRVKTTGTNDTRIDGKYESGVTINGYYYYFKPYKQNNNKIMKEQLFTWTENEQEVYGTKLAVNSAGQYVLEVKGTNAIITKNVDELVEVLPYTFMAKSGSTESHFTGTAGSLNKGDLLIQTSITTSSKIWTVKELDTKNKTAKKFIGRRIVTEEI